MIFLVPEICSMQLEVFLRENFVEKSTFNENLVTHAYARENFETLPQISFNATFYDRNTVSKSTMQHQHV